MSNYVRQAKNGYTRFVMFKDKPVYYRYHCGEQQTILGCKMNKSNWIKHHVKSAEAEMHVKDILKNWCMYENGWLFIHDDGKDDYDSNDSAHLFKYLCQLGTTTRPCALDLIK